MVAAHLATCTECRAELQALADVVDVLPLAAREVAPPPQLKQAILEKVGAGGTITATAAERPRRWSILDLFRFRIPAWGVAMFALIVLLAGSNLMLWRQLRQPVPQSASPLQIITLSGTDAAPSAVGIVIFEKDGYEGTLVVDGMPVLDADHQYQLWLIEDGQRDNGGVFSVAESGYGWLRVTGEKPLQSYNAFGITIEPAGGSSGPTGEKMLGGAL